MLLSWQGVYGMSWQDYDGEIAVMIKDSEIIYTGRFSASALFDVTVFDSLSSLDIFAGKGCRRFA